MRPKIFTEEWWHKIQLKATGLEAWHSHPRCPHEGKCLHDKYRRISLFACKKKLKYLAKKA